MSRFSIASDRTRRRLVWISVGLASILPIFLLLGAFIAVASQWSQVLLGDSVLSAGEFIGTSFVGLGVVGLASLIYVADAEERGKRVAHPVVALFGCLAGVAVWLAPWFVVWIGDVVARGNPLTPNDLLGIALAAFPVIVTLGLLAVNLRRVGIGRAQNDGNKTL